MGRQALAGSGSCSLGAVPVSCCRSLFPSRYFADAVLARVRLSVAVSSVSPVVAGRAFGAGSFFPVGSAFWTGAELLSREPDNRPIPLRLEGDVCEWVIVW